MVYSVPVFRLLETLTTPLNDVKALIESTLLTLILGGVTGFLTVLLSLVVLMFYLVRGTLIRSSFSILTTLFLSLPKIALVGVIFLMFSSFLDSLRVVYMLIIVVSLVCYMPFVLKSFLVDFIQLQRRYNEQIQLLSLSFFETFQIIVWPVLSQQIKGKVAIVICFAMGNLSVPLLLGQLEVKTLPVLSYQALLCYDADLSGFYMSCLLGLMGTISYIFYRSRHVKN